MDEVQIVSSFSGARCVATLLHEMKRRGKDCRFGVISMCIGITHNSARLSCLILVDMLEIFTCCIVGSGMGAAAVSKEGILWMVWGNARMVSSNNLSALKPQLGTFTYSACLVRN